jgi:hypothetical protein
MPLIILFSVSERNGKGLSLDVKTGKKRTASAPTRGGARRKLMAERVQATPTPSRDLE